jgi:hypothetical protein
MVKLIKNHIVFLLLFSLIIAYPVQGDISPSDKTQIQNQINVIVNSINTNNISGILTIISPNARAGLKEEIQTNLEGRAMFFQESITSYEDLGNNRVKVNGVYAAAGPGWRIQGMSNYFIFEKSGDTWLLVDTDFHKKLGPEYVFEVLKKIAIIAVPIFIITGSFWLWMLIDAINREFENKIFWIIIIIVFTFIGAVLYFFIVRRKLKRQRREEI